VGFARWSCGPRDPVTPCSTNAASLFAQQSAPLGARSSSTIVRTTRYAPGSTLESGVGHVTVVVHRQGYDLQTHSARRARLAGEFYTTGMEHSPTSATGIAWDRTALGGQRR